MDNIRVISHMPLHSALYLSHSLGRLDNGLWTTIITYHVAPRRAPLCVNFKLVPEFPQEPSGWYKIVHLCPLC